jgi:hypothetical protein
VKANARVEGALLNVNVLFAAIVLVKKLPKEQLMSSAATAVMFPRTGPSISDIAVVTVPVNVGEAKGAAPVTSATGIDAEAVMALVPLPLTYPVSVVAPVPPLATATVPVTFDAVPVVFWFSVGISAAAIARNVGTPDEPLGADKNVFAVCEAKLSAVTASVPPRVNEPDVVTLPVRVRPLTVPVPDTDVTVPVVGVVQVGAALAPPEVRTCPALP